MCGISGIYGLNGPPIRPDELARQVAPLVHRGPDQGGGYVSPRFNCGLGIRRLSIIDRAGGRQPLKNEDETIYLVYNGETYNHRELRAELEADGHRLRSYSDAEVVLHGYEAWGPEGVLSRMRGMFALALWDDNRQQLFLARDRFGVKPLYYAECAGRLYFASEIKALLAQPDLPRRVNLPALQAMLTLGFVPGPATMFEGIYKLPPATFLLAAAGKICRQSYWRLTYGEQAELSLGQATEQFLALLHESVRLRLMSEVPLGALLSGGLDSGTLVALLQASLAGEPGERSQVTYSRPPALPLQTISIGFEEPAYDEASLAANLAQFFGTQHTNLTCRAADFELYPEVMDHLEEPQCSATALPIYRLYQACRQAGLTVVLTGEGADELLGGYHWHRGDRLVRPFLAWPGWLRRLLAAAPLPVSTAGRRVLARGSREVPRRCQDWWEVAGENYRPGLFSEPVGAELSRAGANPLLAGWANRLAGLETPAVLHQALWLEAQTRLVDFINFEVDKMSMAHSIEARVPFLDHKLWEFCAALPPAFKLRGGTEKYLLRQATRGLLPETTRTRRKKGLAAPYAAWLQAERWPEWAETVVAPSAIRQAGLFNPAVISELRQAHRAGRPDLAPLLMGVVSTSIWWQLFIK